MQRLTANKMPNFSKLSTSAIVIAGLVRSPKNISVHYRQPDIHVTVKVYACVNIKHTKILCSKCPPCARKLARRRGRHCLTASRKWKLEMFPLFNQARFQQVNVTNPAAVHTLLQLTPNFVVYRVEVRTFSCPQSWSDEVWC